MVVAVLAVKPPGPDQLKVTPAVGDAPVNVTVDTTQVRGPDTKALAPGVAMFCKTFTVVVAVQPLTGLVTVKV